MAKGDLISTERTAERALLLGIDRRDSPWPVERSLQELERLADTAGAQTVARLTQRLEKPIPKSYIGSGKVEELKGMVARLDIDVVIFDDDLTPSQQSYLEKAVGSPVKIIDRTALILDIFGLHARTREGRLQVQLAQLQYLLPRLRGMWTHLAKEQTRGGIGSRFGQGESQLEIDRRLIRGKISNLRKQLKDIERRRVVQSKERCSSEAYRIALAGYTNAGKSSLLNILTGASVLAQDKLFATLDPTTRSYALPGGRVVTITDTVGFIQKLPHGLVESFKSTLTEVLESDLIVKVVDTSDEDWERQLNAVDQVLNEIGAGNKKTLVALNKIDLLEPSYKRILTDRYPGCIPFSSVTGEGLTRLLDHLSEEATASDQLIDAMLPYAEGSLLTLAHTSGMVLEEQFLDECIHLVARIPKAYAPRFEPFIRPQDRLQG